MSKSLKKSNSAAAARRSGHGAGVRGGEMFKFRSDEYVLVGFDTVDGPEHHLFQRRVKNPPKDSLVRSIVKYGVIKPVEFEREPPSAAFPKGRILVVDGRNRIKAARRALVILREQVEQAGGDPSKVELFIKGIPRKGSEADLASLMHVSNSHHQEYRPSDEAEAVQRLLAYQLDRETICVTLGLTKAQLKDREAFLGLSLALQNAVDDGKMSISAAVKMSGMSKADQTKELAEYEARGERPTVKHVAGKVREAAGKAPVETPSQKLQRVRGIVDRYFTSDAGAALMTALGDVHLAGEASAALMAALGEIREILAPRPRRTSGMDQSDEEAPVMPPDALTGGADISAELACS